MKKTKRLLLATVLLGALTSSAQISLILEDFDSDTPAILYTGFKFDYTNGSVFNLADTTPNTLGFYAGSGTNYTIVADPLDASNQALWLSGFDNPSQLGKGIYMMRLDPTGGGVYTSGSVEISYSFRMLRDAGDVDSPTNFSVAWVSRPASLDNGSENLDMYQWAGETINQSFVTSGNEAAWQTISGTITADLSILDTTSPYSTGIRVYATNGGFVSGGQGIYYVDDVSVTVTAVPEPGIMALFAGFAGLGIVLYRRRAHS